MTQQRIHEQSHEPLINYLRMHRLKTGFTQDEVAAILRYINRDIISRHERKEVLPSLLIALSYESFYRVPVSDIFVGLAKKVELDVEAQLAEYEKYLGEQSATGPRAVSIARKLEWLSKRRSSEFN
jgi:DNA-binding XRE family transcriptional regulator